MPLYDITEQEAFDLCHRYGNLTQCEKNVFDFLMERDCFEGTQTELTLALNYPKIDNANIRKALLSLEDKSFVYIEYKDKSIFDEDGNIKPGRRPTMKRCFVLDGWWHIPEDIARERARLSEKGGE